MTTPDFGTADAVAKLRNPYSPLVPAINHGQHHYERVSEQAYATREEVVGIAQQEIDRRRAAHERQRTAEES